MQEVNGNTIAEKRRHSEKTQECTNYWMPTQYGNSNPRQIFGVIMMHTSSENANNKKLLQFLVVET